MNQFAFYVEFFTDGQKMFYSFRSAINGQLIACCFDEDAYLVTLKKLLSDFRSASDNSSSVKSPDKE